MTDPRVEKPSNLNLPNILTTLRIVLVPFFGVALLIDGGDSIAWRLVAFGIFVLFLTGADAYVSAHLARFPTPMAIETAGTPNSGMEVAVRVSLPH